MQERAVCKVAPPLGLLTAGGRLSLKASSCIKWLALVCAVIPPYCGGEYSIFICPERENERASLFYSYCKEQRSCLRKYKALSINYTFQWNSTLDLTSEKNVHFCLFKSCIYHSRKTNLFASCQLHITVAADSTGKRGDVYLKVHKAAWFRLTRKITSHLLHIIKIYCTVNVHVKKICSDCQTAPTFANRLFRCETYTINSFLKNIRKCTNVFCIYFENLSNTMIPRCTWMVVC